MKKSTYIPLLLTIYLGVMSYIGRDEFYAGNYVYYFSIIGATLLCIVLLHFFLKKRDKLAQEQRPSALFLSTNSRFFDLLGGFMITPISED